MFGRIWARISRLARDGMLIAPDEVLKEIEDGLADDPVRVWAERHPIVFQEKDDDQGQVVTDIWTSLRMNDYGATKRNRADKWVVALAAVMVGKGHAITVIAGERDGPTRIPAICGTFGIECISLYEFIRREVPDGGE